MADPLTKAQRAFIAIEKKGDIPAAVQLARAVLIGGLRVGVNFDEDANSYARELAGELDPARGPGREVNWENYCAHLLAALAMGIALGQLVHPDVFKAGGVK